MADPFERGLLLRFRSSPELEELSGFRTVSGERVFYSARPLRVTQPYCLRCHTSPEQAPSELIAQYGTEGGFGWQLNEIVAAQIITVPAAEVLGRARLSLAIVMVIFAAVFAVVILSINLLLRRSVIQPLERISALAQRVGMGELGAEEPDNLADIAGRTDELGHLAQVFDEMAREVRAREQRLKEQMQELVIRIDEVRKSDQVSQITDSDYFKALQEKARELRGRSERKSSPDVKPESEIEPQEGPSR